MYAGAAAPMLRSMSLLRLLTAAILGAALTAPATASALAPGDFDPPFGGGTGIAGPIDGENPPPR